MGHKNDDNAEPHGFFRSLFSFIFSCCLYLGLTIFTITIVPIVLDCMGIGNRVPCNQPLCKDVCLLLSFSKPSAAFEKNVRNSCSAVFSRYHTQAKSLLAPISKWISENWSEFMKTDNGKKVEQLLYKIHKFVLDTWNKVH